MFYTHVVFKKITPGNPKKRPNNSRRKLQFSRFTNKSLDIKDSVTVMMKNIPCGCSQQQVLDAIADVGFADLHMFFYLPTRRSKSLGYAFVGFADVPTTRSC